MVQATGESRDGMRENGHHQANGFSQRCDHGSGAPEHRSWVARFLKRKPFEVVRAEEAEGALERTLGFFDLFAIGVGGTVGSGVFVMTGLISHKLAGPAGVISWIVAGLGCIINGTSFAEMSWRVPSAGGPYAYTFVALGEFPATLVGWCLSLEYGISGAAVAKSWGEMLSVFLGTDSGDDDNSSRMEATPEGHSVLGVGLGPEGVLDLGGLYGAILQAVCVLIVMRGLKTSKFTVNVFSFAKALLVVFMTITAFTIFRRDNFVPFSPFGGSGVLKGSVSAFFGYLGFDEMVLLAPETKNPAKNVPRALFSSLFVVILACCLASLALSGAQSAGRIDSDSAFAELFKDKGLEAAHQITAVGELTTLPIVVLITFMAQPRLLFAMAKDGLMPRLFAEMDSDGNLVKGSLASGFVCILIAALVPFDSLDDLISAGVLLSFNFVTSSLLVLRHSASCSVRPVSMVEGSMIEGVPSGKQSAKSAVERVLLANAFAILGGILASLGGFSTATEGVLMVGATSAYCGCMMALSVLKSQPVCPGHPSEGNFRAPFFPWLQGAALMVNWFLLCQLPRDGLFALGGYTCIAIVHYILYGISHSVGNCSNWSLMLTTSEGTNGHRRASDNCSPFSALSSLHGLPTVEGVDVPLLGRRESDEWKGGESDEEDLDRTELGSESPRESPPSKPQSFSPSAPSPSEKLVRRRTLDVIN